MGGCDREVDSATAVRGSYSGHRKRQRGEDKLTLAPIQPVPGKFKKKSTRKQKTILYYILRPRLVPKIFGFRLL